MRSLEIPSPLLLALYLIWPQPRPLIIRLAPAVALALILIHFIFEGYRWQMIPLYFLTGLLAINALIMIQFSQDWKPIASFLTLILLIISTAVPILLPVPSIPKPSGNYRVGTMTFDLTDNTRRELYSRNDEPRRFQIQVWYPSDPKPTNRHASWMNHADIFGYALSSFLNLPSFFLDYLSLVKTPAFQDSPLVSSNTGLPVIVFSHGWKGFAAQNSGQAIELASHGYVVIGVQHTYGAVVTVFDDGSIAPNNPNALPEGVPDEEYDVAARRLVAQWSGDISFALKFINEQNQNRNSLFYSALDMTRLGIYGHSTGGGAAIQFCGTDLRCKALIGLDPFMTPVSLEVLRRGTTQPAFYMFSQAWADDSNSKNNHLFEEYYSHIAPSNRVVSVEGAHHQDFSDLPLLSPIAAQLGLKGSIRGRRMIMIMNNYLLAFFDAKLKNKPTTLFDGPTQNFPEVQFVH